MDSAYLRRRNQPPRRHPCPDDGLHQLAKRVYEDFERIILSGGNPWGCAGTLWGLGYEDWISSTSGYTAPSTPRRRTRVLEKIQKFQWWSEASWWMDYLGYNPPQRDCGSKVEPIQAYLNISGEGRINFGHRTDTRGYKLLTARFERCFLRVLDGEDLVAAIATPGSGGTTTLEDLGLNDDDYRFHLGLEGPGGNGPGPGAPRSSANLTMEIF